MSKRSMCVAAAITLASAACAQASIVTVGGDLQQIAPPASTLLGAVQDNVFARIFPERVGHSLGGALPVQITAPGLVNAASDLTPGFVPAGTVFDCFYLWSDPVVGSVQNYSGFVIFDQPIIGIIVGRQELNLTDAPLGNPGTAYGDNSARGLELGSDQLILSVSMFRVDFAFNTSTATDDIRIITLPTPGAAGLLGLAAAAGLRRRR